MTAVSGSESVGEKLEAESHLVDYGGVVGGSFVVHGPPSIGELKLSKQACSLTGVVVLAGNSKKIHFFMHSFTLCVLHLPSNSDRSLFSD